MSMEKQIISFNMQQLNTKPAVEAVICMHKNATIMLEVLEHNALGGIMHSALALALLALSCFMFSYSWSGQ